MLKQIIAISFMFTFIAAASNAHAIGPASLLRGLAQAPVLTEAKLDFGAPNVGLNGTSERSRYCAVPVETGAIPSLFVAPTLSI